MSLHNIAVGASDDSRFRWEGGDSNGNLPRAILDLGFIGATAHVQAGRLLESEYGGRRLDWGSTGALLAKSQIEDFLRACGINDARWRRKAISRVAALDGSSIYVLYVFES